MYGVQGMVGQAVMPAAIAAGQQALTGIQTVDAAALGASQTSFQMASAPAAIANAGTSALLSLGHNEGHWEGSRFIIGLTLALVAGAGSALVWRRYMTSLKIDGQSIGGIMPAGSFPEVVVDRMTNGLRMFYKLDDLFTAWRQAETDDRTTRKQEKTPQGEYEVTITRKPASVFGRFASAYSVAYTYSDGELRRVVAGRSGGILGNKSFEFVPHRELPKPVQHGSREAKIEVVNIAAVGHFPNYLSNLHELVILKGSDIKLFPTVDDFRLAFGEPVGVYEQSHGRPYRKTTWYGKDRVELFESTEPTIFGGAFGNWLHDTNEANGELRRIGRAYSTGILTVVYDSTGRRTKTLESCEQYTSYEVRYNYGRNGKLLRAMILKRYFSLSDYEIKRDSLGSETFLTYKPGIGIEYGDNPPDGVDSPDRFPGDMDDGESSTR